MEGPCALLALFAAVLGSAAPAALSKLPRKLFPFAALIVGTLSDPTPSIIFPAKIAHYDASPVLHVSAVIPDCELLYKRKNIEIVWQKILFFVLLVAERFHGNIVAVKQL